MKSQMAYLNLLLLVMLPVVLTPGCATPYLWNRTSSFQWKPVYVVRVLAVTNTERQCDAVVVFKQSAEVGINYFSRDVAWRVSEPSNELATTSGAIRQLTNSAAGCETVPMYWPSKVPVNATAQPPGYAVLKVPSEQVTIHRDGVSPGPYMLPTSPHPKNTTQRVLLTPLAVMVDVPFCAFALVVYVALHV